MDYHMKTGGKITVHLESAEGIGQVIIETASDGIWIAIPEFRGGIPFAKIDLYRDPDEPARVYPKELRVFADDEEPIFAMNLTGELKPSLREDVEIVTRPSFLNRMEVRFIWTVDEEEDNE